MEKEGLPRCETDTASFVGAKIAKSMPGISKGCGVEFDTEGTIAFNLGSSGFSSGRKQFMSGTCGTNGHGGVFFG